MLATWIRPSPDLLLVSCVTSSTLLSLSEPQFLLYDSRGYPHFTGEGRGQRLTYGRVRIRAMVSDLVQLLVTGSGTTPKLSDLN
jgi:hypothetical protein